MKTKNTQLKRHVLNLKSIVTVFITQQQELVYELSELSLSVVRKFLLQSSSRLFFTL